MTEAPQEYITDALEILNNSKQLDSKCGVYFLISGNEIVYVGQSVNIPSRIEQHKKDQQKTFDRYYYIECKVTELDVVEGRYIRKFMPKYNKVIPREGTPTRKSDYSFIWYNTKSLHVFPLITVIEWMKREGMGQEKNYTEKDFDGFLIFTEWYRFTHKKAEFLCLPSDLHKWYSDGKPTMEDLRK